MQESYVKDDYAKFGTRGYFSLLYMLVYIQCVHNNELEACQYHQRSTLLILIPYYALCTAVYPVNKDFINFLNK